MIHLITEIRPALRDGEILTSGKLIELVLLNMDNNQLVFKTLTGVEMFNRSVVMHPEIKMGEHRKAKRRNIYIISIFMKIVQDYFEDINHALLANTNATITIGGLLKSRHFRRVLDAGGPSGLVRCLDDTAWHIHHNMLLFQISVQHCI